MYKSKWATILYVVASVGQVEVQWHYVHKKWHQLTIRLNNQQFFPLMAWASSQKTMAGFIGLKLSVSGSMWHHFIFYWFFYTWFGQHRVQSLTLLRIFGMCCRSLYTTALLIICSCVHTILVKNYAKLDGSLLKRCHDALVLLSKLKMVQYNITLSDFFFLVMQCFIMVLHLMSIFISNYHSRTKRSLSIFCTISKKKKRKEKPIHFTAKFHIWEHESISFLLWLWTAVIFLINCCCSEMRQRKAETLYTLFHYFCTCNNETSAWFLSLLTVPFGSNYCFGNLKTLLL